MSSVPNDKKPASYVKILGRNVPGRRTTNEKILRQEQA